MIRPYHVDDRAALLEIFKLNTPQYFALQEIKDFETYLNDNSDTYLTIKHQNKIVGGTGYQITNNGTIGRVTWIFFHPDSTGLGLGRQSLDYCMALFKRTPTIQKLVVTTSQLAFKFFDKFGFKLIKTEKDYWGPGLDLYLMEMELG